MLSILKKYLKAKAKKDYPILSVRNLIVCICMGALFYMNGTKGKLPQASFAVTAGLSVVLMILSLGVGNFIFIFRGKFSSKISKDVLSAITAILLGLASNYLYYKVGGIVLFPVTLIIYGLSLVANDKVYLNQKSING